jgi:hypothetical protein
MAKIVYNGDFGGFGLSDKAIARYAELKGLSLHKKEEDEYYSFWCYSDNEYDYFDVSSIYRNDPCLVQVVEELGADADSNYSDLCIREVPDGSRYYIDEYDGNEIVVLESEHVWQIA